MLLPQIIRLLLALLFFASSGLLTVRAVEPAAAEPAGEDFLIQNWQTEEGLPRNTLNSVAQDRNGFLWLGTPYDLVRHDGVRFESFQSNVPFPFGQQGGQRLVASPSGDLWFAPGRAGPFQLRDGVAAPVLAAGAWDDLAIDSMHQDPRGVLWLVDVNGRLGYVEDGRFKETANLGKITSGPMLFRLCADAAGQIWFFRQDTYGRIISGQPTNYTRLGDAVINMTRSRDGGMWLSTGRALWRIPAGSFKATNLVCALPFGTYGTTALTEDRSGVLWLGTLRDGIYRLQGSNLAKIQGTHHQVQDILEDAEGTIWAATDGAGLFKILPRVFQVLGEKEGLTHATVTSVCGEWAAPAGGGLGRIQPLGGVEMLPEHSSNSVTAVMEDGAGGAWLGTAASRLIHRTADGQLQADIAVGAPGTQVRVLHRDRLGNLWVGGYAHGLYFLAADGSSPLTDMSRKEFSGSAINAIAEDKDGMIWIGTSHGELFGFKEGVFHAHGTSKDLAGFPIGSLLADRHGRVWIGTLGGGLGCFHDGQMKLFGSRVGLNDDVISQLVEDEAGWLWVGTTRGISRVRLADLTGLAEGRRDSVSASHFGRSAGLANIQCTAGSQPSVWKTRAGKIQFATSQGVVVFDPALLPLNLRPPPLVLERVLVDGTTVASLSNIELRHDFKKIEFRYNAPSLVAPEKVQFKRRLTGFDENWIVENDPTRRSASYPLLPPGKYEFQFTACNNEGVWNDEVFSMPFVVVPAFWQTMWFRAATVVVAAGGLAAVVFLAARIRMRRKLARLQQANALERERTRISRDLHDDLGARLTQMALLTDLAAEDPGASPDLKGQIKEVSGQARYAVQSLDETVWMINPQKDTLAHVIGYVARYAEQFFQPTPITCLQDICRQPPECMMPGKLRRDILMLVKEALNNVVKHSQAREVRLRISARGGAMRITVRDNGRGFAGGAPDARRHGLDSMLRRAESARIKVTVRSQPGRGTLVALRVPLPLDDKLPGRAKD